MQRGIFLKGTIVLAAYSYYLGEAKGTETEMETQFIVSTKRYFSSVMQYPGVSIINFSNTN
jgi:hypothetical protein